VGVLSDVREVVVFSGKVKARSRPLSLFSNISSSKLSPAFFASDGSLPVPGSSVLDAGNSSLVF
jgi:hypothetical protein